MRDTTIHFTNISGEITFEHFESYLKKLPLNEQSRVLQYRNWHDQLSCLLGIALIVHFVFKREISELKTLKLNNFGKPYTHNNVFFNISHAGDFVIMAVSKQFEMGIDIEKITNVTLSDFRNQMTELEWKRIANCTLNQKKEFYDYWTQKEAAIKAVGQGLAIPLQSFEIIDLKTVIYGHNYYLKECYIDKQYCCHIATTDQHLNISSPIYIENIYLIS